MQYLFSLGHWPLFPTWSNKEMTAANTTTIQCEGIKIRPIYFCQMG